MFSHPYIGTPLAAVAALNPLWENALSAESPVLSVTLQVLGVIFLAAQIYFLFKNKGKK